MPNQNLSVTELSRVRILTVCGFIRGDIDANIQGIKSQFSQSSQVRTRGTCVVTSWPTAHSYTAINHLTSYTVGPLIIQSLWTKK